MPMAGFDGDRESCRSGLEHSDVLVDEDWLGSIVQVLRSCLTFPMGM